MSRSRDSPLSPLRGNRRQVSATPVSCDGERRFQSDLDCRPRIGVRPIVNRYLNIDPVLKWRKPTNRRRCSSQSRKVSDLKLAGSVTGLILLKYGFVSWQRSRW